MRVARRLIGPLAVAGALAPSDAKAQLLPDGFSSTIVVGPPFSGNVVAFAFLPDQRRLLVERDSGRIRLAAVGSTSSTVIHTVPDVNWIEPERGLLAIAVDPDWPVRPYIYVYYTHVDSTAYLTMYQASGDLSNPGSVNVSLGAPFHLLTDLPDEFQAHNGGHLHFDANRMLYLSLGDDQRPCFAQDLTVPHGSILRLDVSSMPGAGSGPPPKADITPEDNPFSGPNDWARLRYAWGLRNPWSFSIDPSTFDLYVGDVGWNAEEEVDLIPSAKPGGNYGWPQREGFSNPACCGNCGVGNLFVDPIYSYPHDENPKTIIGGPLYRLVPGGAANFPVSYDGSYFFLEWWDGWIRRLEKKGAVWQVAAPASGQPSPENWAEGFACATDLQRGPDGALYVLRVSCSPGGLYRIHADPVTAVRDVATDAVPKSEPNPATAGSGTTIRFQVSRAGPVTLRIVDVSGRSVRTLVAAAMPAGVHSVHWDGRTDDGSPASGGTYLWRLVTAGGEPVAGKISLIR
jgi:glucose/arabinose dehydrogenase